VEVRALFAECTYCQEEVPAVYDPVDEAIILFLPAIKRASEREGVDIVDELVRLINHEVMHHIIAEVLGSPTPSRVAAEHRVMEKLGVY